MIRESAGSRLTSSYGFTCRPVSVASVGYNTSTVKMKSGGCGGTGFRRCWDVHGVCVYCVLGEM